MQPEGSPRISVIGYGGRSKILKVLVLTVLGGGMIQAKDLGSYGTTFDILEENLLARIQEKLSILEKSGEMKSHQLALTKRVNERVLRPLPVEGLSLVTQNSVKEYDPTFILDQDIKDHEGNLIGEKGTRYNPLDYMSFGVPLLFIDGDDDQQVNWSLSQEGKIVLVNGSPILLENQHQKPFYFDQKGAIAKRLDIDQIPAKVSQDGKKLRIEFVNLSEK